MWNLRRKGLLCAAAVLTVAGCSSSTKTAGGSPGSAGSASNEPTYTIGLLTDLTGPAASASKTSVQGVEAGIAEAAKEGYHIKYVVADTQTSPSGALSAAQSLVEQHHVLAVVAVSALTFGASSYLTKQGIPVVGVSEDASEWLTASNMFSTFGAIDVSKVTTRDGKFYKMEGVKNLGAVAYSISPRSVQSAEASAASAQAAGIKVGYLNTKLPFGTTNVGPIALAMKSAGVDAFTAPVDPNTALLMATALRQAGAQIKVALLATGYGGDLLQAGPGAVQSAQGVYFILPWEPVEMHDTATKTFESALRDVGVQGDPTYGEYGGYTSVLMLVQGLKAAGANPTQGSLITGLSSLKHFNAGGLLGSHSFDTGDKSTQVIGADACEWVTKLSGSKFELVPGADPICGSIVPGKTVGS